MRRAAPISLMSGGCAGMDALPLVRISNAADGCAAQHHAWSTSTCSPTVQIQCCD
jgi:hypothetical protein